MKYIQETPGNQLSLAPFCLDDLVDDNSSVHLINGFVNAIAPRFSLLGFKEKTSRTGRPSYLVATLLKLFIYGYLHRVRSSRRLEAEACRNVEVMWLTGQLKPDDRTICNFRKNNKNALAKILKEFNLWCKSLDLFGGKLVGIDGTKCRANASKKHFRTGAYLQAEQDTLGKIHAAVAEYLRILDSNDGEELKTEKLSRATIEKALKQLEKQKEMLSKNLDAIGDKKTINTTDPDAKLMPTGGEGRAFDARYNIIAAVDDKHGLVATVQVVDSTNDSGHLFDIAKETKEMMGVEALAIVADRGFVNGEDVTRCEVEGLQCHLPPIALKGHAPTVDFDKDRFIYNEECNAYTCPVGQTLHYKRAVTPAKAHPYHLYENPKACKSCPKNHLCTANKNKFRSITRSIYQGSMDAIDQRRQTKEGKAILRRRKAIVEAPFGVVKHVWGYQQFLCRGKEAVQCESAMAFLAYNFRRLINIFRAKKVTLKTLFA